jgi:hypothetical protein
MSYMPQDPASKIEIAKEKKEIADTAFKNGDLQTGQFELIWALAILCFTDASFIALLKYHEVSALLLLLLAYEPVWLLESSADGSAPRQ